MPGLDHPSDRPGDTGSEELLDAGRRPLPRWAVLACVAVVAVAIITIVRNNSAAHKQSAARTPAPSATLFPSFPAPHRSPVGLDVDSAVGPPIHGGHTLDVAVTGETSWLLQPRALVAVVRNRTQHTVRIPGPSLTADNAAAKLVLDVPAGVLWVVTEGAVPARLLEYDVVGLRLVREVHPPGDVTGAAALDGHLLLTSGAQLFDFPARKGKVTAVSVESLLGGVVADPARHRLLMFAYGTNTRVWPIVLTAHGRAVLGRPVLVAVSKPTMGVAQGSVWIAGFGGTRWVLSRLDPRTLQPTTESPVDSVFSANGAEIVASGVVVIWARDQVGGKLRCIDAVTGQQLQTWMISGAVASGGVHGLVATAAGAVPLDLSACSG